MKLLAYGLLIVLATNSMEKCNPEMEGQVVNMNETFELELDKAVGIKGEKLGITFTKAQEGRCPLEVNCIQAGEGRVTLQIANGGGTETLVLEAKGLCHKEDGSCGETKTVMGYNVKLISLNPYPGSEAAKNKEVAKVTLMVSKN
jgi:hypothetical protein